MTFERYRLTKANFHYIQIEDQIKNRKYGNFDRFEKPQLQRLCDHLNEENQAAQDYEDFVAEAIISAIETERTKMGKSVLKQFAETLGVEL